MIDRLSGPIIDRFDMMVITNEWLLILAGLLSLGLGVLLVFQPAAGAVGVPLINTQPFVPPGKLQLEGAQE